MTAKTPRPAKAASAAKAPAKTAAKAASSPKKKAPAARKAAGVATQAKSVRTSAAAPRAAGRPAAKTAGRAKPAAKKTAARKAPVKKTPAAKSAGRAVSTPPAAVPKAPRQRTQPRAARETDVVARLRDVVVKALEDLKARDTVELDVAGRTSIADIIIVAGGTSSRHVKSIADEVIKQTKKAGLPPLGVEGQREGEWVLVDLGDIVVHIMLPRAREFYGLERLWSVDGDSRQEAAAV